MTGSWDDPKIELVKMFENRSKIIPVVEPSRLTAQINKGETRWCVCNSNGQW